MEKPRKELLQLRAQIPAFSDKVINTVPALVVGLDLDGTVVFFNDRCERVTGWRRQEALGQHWFTNFLPERVRPATETVFQNLVESLEESEYENLILTKAGQERVIAWCNTVLRDASDQVSLVIATGIDVTEQRQAEHTLRALNSAALVVQQILEPQKIFEVTARELGHLGFGCTVLLSDEDQDNLEVVFSTFSAQACAAAEQLTGLRMIGYRVPVERVEVFRTTCREQRTILISEAEEMVRQFLTPELARQVTRLLDLPRFIVAPLVAGDMLLGVLSVHSPVLDGPHLPAVTAFANQVAVALRNARLYAEIKSRIVEQSALLKASVTISATLDLSAVLDHLAEQMARAIDTTSAYICDWDPEADTSTVLAEYMGADALAQERVSDLGVTYQLSRDFPSIASLVGAGRVDVLHLDDPDLSEPDGAHMRQYGAQSILLIPLLVKDTIIGYAELWESRRRREFGPAEIALCQGIAQQAALAIENTRLFNETQAALTKTQALYRAGSSLIAFKSLPDVLQAVVDGVAAALPADRVTLITFDQDNQVTHFVKGGPGADQVVTVSFDELWDGLSGWVLRQPHPRPALSPKAVPDPRESPAVQRRRAATNCGAIIVAPLHYRDQTMGTMTAINRPDQREFTPQDVELMTAMANQAVIALENARLYEAQRQQADELTQLHRASTALFFSMTADLPTLAQNIVQAVLREFGQANCSLLLLKPATGELERIGVAGPYVSQVTRARLTLDGPGLVPLAARSGQIVNVPDVLTNPHYVANWEQAQSEMAVPLQVGERVIGVLDVQSKRPDAFGPVDERLLINFAERAALALETARLYQESQRRQAEASALYEATRPIDSLELSSVLETLADRALALTDLPHCIISLLEPDETAARIVAVRGYPEGRAQMLLNQLFEPQDYPSSWRAVVMEQRPHVIPDTQADLSLAPEQAPSLPAKALLVVPLITGDRLVGSLQLSGEARPLPDELVRQVETFATQAAITIENARLYSAVQEFAHSLQIATREKEQLLEQLQQHAETLEQEVAARTAEIFAEKEKVEAILKSAADAIIITDPQGRIDYVNDAFIALSGYPASEVLGRIARRVLFTDRTPPATTADMQRAATQGVLWRGDLYVGHKDGHVLETEVMLAPVRDQSGQIVSFVSSVRDVSQVRALARAKSEFLTNVSHQLRTPATNLKTFAYLLGKGSAEKQAHYIQVMQGEIEKLLQLIRDLLEVVELDAGTIVSDWYPVSPNELVTSLVTRYRAQAEAAGLALEAALPADLLPPVMGSKQRFAQALRKIVENAILFTTAGEVTVGARLDDAAPSGTPEIVMWVSDTGPGIALDELDQIFERFFRGRAAQPGHILGTGLGLSVARMIVEAHNGRLEVQSVPGQGSTFEVRLPLS